MDSVRRVGAQNGGAAPDEQLRRLRELLMGSELDIIRSRLDDPQIRAEETSHIVAEAIALRSRRGSQIRQALQPSIEAALRISVQRDPHVLADLLFPVIGPAIRKAVTASLSSMLDALNKILEQSLSVKAITWRMEGWRTGKSFGEIVLLRSLLYKVEEVFLIHKETGLLLQHQVAKSAVVRDADLVSGMLTAIQEFVRDSFAPSEAKDLEKIQVDEFQVWVQHGPEALLACVVRGVPPSEFGAMLQERLETIHGTMGASLEHFHGDTTAFDSTRPILQSCLTGQLAATERRKFPWILSAIGVVVVLIAATFLFFYFRDQRRWSAYLDKLNNEPGILITSAHAGIRHYWLSGLRDPLAKDPEVLLEGTGIPPARITSRWEPYISADSRFTGVRQFESEKEIVERQAIFFASGSSEISPEALWLVSNELRSLFHAADSVGRDVGGTEGLGQDSLNANLAQDRAERVISELVKQGVPDQRLVSKIGIRATRTEDRQSTAWYERRASFHVVSNP